MSGDMHRLRSQRPCKAEGKKALLLGMAAGDLHQRVRPFERCLQNGTFSVASALHRRDGPLAPNLR